MGKVEAKGTCKYCGKQLSKAGIANHEKACSKNPANQSVEAVEEVIEAVEVEETSETVEQVKEEETLKAEEDLVTIKVKADLNCYIGDRYYRFSAGEVCEVPKSVKERLMGAGLLEAI